MSSTQGPHKGVTPPISSSFPTPAEIISNDALIEELKKQSSFEGAEETERRKKVLQIIMKVTVQFVKEAMERKGRFSQSVINAAGGKIFTYGSYRLGVYGPGSDIDTLVVAPKDVTLEDFFELFPVVLERLSPPGAIEEMTPVPDAFVPIIKLEFMGISIDLIFASIALASVPPTLELKDNNLLRGLDDRGLRSLNGTRVTDEILELVPQQKTFGTALRAVKLWAQRRAIYANVMGFPGGVAWAMLVARTCQLYPQATGSVIVGKFFRIMSRWAWPQPVMLKEIESGPLQVRVWNPTVYKADQYHLMPIITPAYPSMCATHNITLSTKTIILKELVRGGDIVDQIYMNKAQWKDLFQKNSFFTNNYKYYLSIVSTSKSKEAQLLWSGLVESKVRHLVTDLEHDEFIQLAHPFNKGFDRVHRCHNDIEVEAVMNGDLRYQATEIKTETTDSTNDPKHNAAVEGGDNNIPMTDTSNEKISNGSELTTLHTTTYYVGLELTQAAKKLDISWSTNKFRDLCQQWPSFNSEVHCLHVVHTRNFDLPDDVFQPGETKPIRPAKKKVSKKENSAKKENVRNGSQNMSPASKKRKLEGDEALIFARSNSALYDYEYQTTQEITFRGRTVCQHTRLTGLALKSTGASGSDGWESHQSHQQEVHAELSSVSPFLKTETGPMLTANQRLRGIYDFAQSKTTIRWKMSIGRIAWPDDFRERF